MYINISFYFSQEKEEKKTRTIPPPPLFFDNQFLFFILSLATRVLKKYLAPPSLSSGGRPQEKPGEAHLGNLC